MTTETRADRRPRIFYGWYVLGLGMLGSFMVGSASQLFMASMLVPIASGTGWSRTAISGAVTAGSVASGLMAPAFGRLADRYGPRPLSALGVVVTSAAYLLMASSTHIAAFWLAYVVARAVSQCTLGNIVPRATAVQWFHRMRGRALGLVQMSLPLGVAAMVLIARAIMERTGSWRDVYIAFGFAIFAVLFFPILLVMRRRPEDMGLRPDGDRAGEKPRKGEPRKRTLEAERSWNLQEALCTPALWLIICGMAVSTAANGLVGFHQTAYFMDRGIAAGVAVTALSVYGLSGAVANVLWGFLTERFSERLVATGALLLGTAMPLFALSVDSAVGVFVFAIFMGAVARGEGALISLILAQYFGREHFGAIIGFTGPFQMVSLGLGPLLGAVAYEFGGHSYAGVFMVTSAAYAVSALLIWLAREPRPKAPRACSR